MPQVQAIKIAEIHEIDYRLRYIVEYEHPNHGTQRPTYFFDKATSHAECVNQILQHLVDDELYQSASKKPDTRAKPTGKPARQKEVGKVI